MDHSDLSPERPAPGRRRALPAEPVSPAPEVATAPEPPAAEPVVPEFVVPAAVPAAPAPWSVEPVVAHVAPLDVDGVRTVAVGTALWGLALVALLPFYGWLADTGRVWWLWTCSAGLGLGLIGLDICLRRRARAQEEARARLGATSGGRRRR